MRRPGKIVMSVRSSGLSLSLLLCFGLTTSAEAQDALPPGLTFERGLVLVKDLATITLADHFVYLQQADARRIVEQHWGSLPDDGILGLILPVYEGTPHDAWGVVISFTDDGHIEDDDADDIDWDEMLAELKESEAEVNEERKRLGMETLTLIGWTTPPHYEKETKRIYWGKTLQVGNAPLRTVNSDIRVLGRTGALTLSAVGVEPDLPVLEAAMTTLLPHVQFVDGKRYDQFDSDLDSVAAYGIGALVAGKVAAKIGLLAKLGVILLAGKKLILFAVIGIGAFLAKRFGKKKDVV